MRQVDVALPVRVRVIRPDDRDALTRFYAGLSPDSLEARFHGASRGIGDGAARFFCGPDHEHREGLLAETDGPDGRPLIIGHLCLEPIDLASAEMAIAVADEYQHHGIGKALLRQGIAWARCHGMTRLSATMRWSHPAVLALLRSTGRQVTFSRTDEDTVDAVIDVRVPVLDAA